MDTVTTAPAPARYVVAWNDGTIIRVVAVAGPADLDAERLAVARSLFAQWGPIEASEPSNPAEAEEFLFTYWPTVTVAYFDGAEA